MKNGKRKVIAQIAGPGLVLAALLVLVLSNACIGRAQSSSASVTPVATPVQAAAAAPALPAHKPPSKGQHEGIKVHGQWTIEVRNPDGKLVSHTEFENALVQPGGAQTLTSMLLGTSVPGGYEVTLASSNSSFSPPGPCAQLGTNPTTACYFVGSLISPEPAGFGDSFIECGGTGFANQITASGPCFPLSISAGAPTGLAFSGTAVASTATPITDVYLSPLTCQNSATSLGSVTVSSNSCAQGASSQGEGTHATLPTPVQISAAGQLISVNVQLSFQ
ncbi:MAG TPA: hypothetical protein VME23_14675 [Terracidiphilus sp.]|nr:hypothetical protein [Terracidiphilus sp.]